MVPGGGEIAELAKSAAPSRPQKRIVLAIGLPGSGKSTYFRRKGIVPLSSDLIRQLLYDHPAEQRLPHYVFEALRHLLRLRLLAGQRVSYVDATNLTRRDRRHFFSIARSFGGVVDALYFDVPLEVCLERNLRRARRVPEAAVRRMARQLEPPAVEEGFRRIVTVRAPGGKTRGSGPRNRL
jgi:predicted kinase